jgi:Cu/Ag efflux protein CusF
MHRRTWLVLVASIGLGSLAPQRALAATQQFRTHGVVKRIADDRRSVHIAHDDIAGYMPAMTMSFSPRNAAQLDGIAVGDRVSFTFTDDGEGRRVIDAIARDDAPHEQAARAPSDHAPRV